MPYVKNRRPVFHTPWFRVVAKDVAGLGADEPFYILEGSDYVTVLPVTDRADVVLVRQYRPAVERYTVEFPSGHIDPGETPEQAARRELLEETSYRADALSLLGTLHSDTGRHANRLWCFFAADVVRDPEAQIAEPTLKPMVVPLNGFLRYVTEDGSEFEHALDFAVISLAMLRNRLSP